MPLNKNIKKVLVIGILFALVFKYKHQRENKVN